MSEPPLTAHECGAPAHRIISQSSFTLKGGGWYADGYGDKKKSESKSESKSETKTETKSDAPKTDSKPSENKAA
jgi:predicted nucleic acid-binding Zn ribbon protein